MTKTTEKSGESIPPPCYWAVHTHSKLSMAGSSPSDTNIKRWKGGGEKTLNTFEGKMDHSAIVDSDNLQYEIVEYLKADLLYKNRNTVL